MKIKKSSVRVARAKSVPQNVDQYIARVPDAVRKRFTALRAAIRSAVPKGATEVISYRIPAFKQDRILVWFAAFSKHCSLFPTAEVIEKFKTELKDLSTSKGTIHFPNDKPLPIALIKKMVKARIKLTHSRQD
ncbi:MAG TPA: DUF1801 domain-containing protein [Pyrinomonadaceae bacterium]